MVPSEVKLVTFLPHYCLSLLPSLSPPQYCWALVLSEAYIWVKSMRVGRNFDNMNSKKRSCHVFIWDEKKVLKPEINI